MGDAVSMVASWNAAAPVNRVRLTSDDMSKSHSLFDLGNWASVLSRSVFQRGMVVFKGMFR